jgi:hypothetical protein
LHINAVSSILYGQTLNAEFGKRGSIALRLRSLNAVFIEANAWDSSSSAAFSPGVGLVARYYYSRQRLNLRGLYIGAALEYHLFRGRQPELEWAIGTMVPSAELGYRWVHGHVIFGLGGAFGWGFQIHEKRKYWFGYEDEGNGIGRELGGVMVEGNLEVGWLF